MNLLMAGPTEALIQVAARDTVVFVSAAQNLERWADIAVLMLALMVLALVLISAASVVQLRRMVIAGTRLLEDLRRQVDPVTERAKVVADNLSYVSAIVREDVERLSSTVSALTHRLDQASDRVEERIEEFNALLEVAQNEAEGLFIDTASTVRAVRAGARSLSRGPEPPAPPVEEGP